MNGSMILFVLFAIRFAFPIALTLLVGDWMHHKESNYWLKRG